MKSTLCTSLSLLALSAGGVLSSAPAHAVQQANFENAVGACNGALPGFEGALRKRPLAIANEGTSNAVVSCTLPINQFRTTGNTVVGIALINRSSAVAAVSCTFVDGSAPEVIGAITPTYYTKNIALAAGEGNTLQWNPVDYGLTKFSVLASTSCSLPPGAEIAAIVTLYDDGL